MTCTIRRIVTLVALYYYYYYYCNTSTPSRLKNFHISALFVAGFISQTNRYTSSSYRTTFDNNKIIIIINTDRCTNNYDNKHHRCSFQLYDNPNNKDIHNNNNDDLNTISVPLSSSDNRRSILQKSVISVLGTLSSSSSLFGIGNNNNHNNILVPQPPSAAAAVDAGEAIRRSAANIPGYGPTDIFYPADWLGIWQVRRDVFLPGATEPITLEYKIRFIPSIQDNNAVVADRGYNQIALEIAIRSKNQNDVNTNTIIRSFKWSETNPNDLFIEFYDGTLKYIKVTKRSTEYDNTATNTISSSEFQRVTQDITNGNGGISVPTITARRVVSKWKQFNNNDNDDPSKITKIEAIEIVYDMGTGLGDPLSFQQQQQQQTEPAILSKSKLVLQRPI